MLFWRIDLNARTLIPTLGLLLVPALAGAAERPLSPDPDPTDRSARIEVDLSEKKLYVYNNGSLMNTFPVAIGDEEHPTPTGDFTIGRLIWNPAWVPPPNAEWAEDETKKAPDDPDNPMEGAKLFFEYPDYYIHGTDATNTLGTAASHGCLRMRPVDVENLGKFVQEVGGEGRSEGWYDRIQESDTDKREINLPDPVPISIHW